MEAVAKQKAGNITQAELKQYFNRKDYPFNLHEIEETPPLLGFYVDLQDGKRFTLKANKNNTDTISLECAVLLSFALYLKNLHKQGHPYGSVSMTPDEHKKMCKTIRDDLANLGYAVVSNKQVQFMLEKVTESLGSFESIGLYFADILTKSEANATAVDESFDSTAAVNGGAGEVEHHANLSRKNLELCSKALCGTAITQGLAGADDVSVSDETVCTAETVRTNYSALKELLDDDFSVNTETSREVLKRARLLFSSPPKGWPGPIPKSEEEEKEWYDKELDHFVEALRDANQELKQAKGDIQVLWNTIRCLNGVLLCIGGKIGELHSAPNQVKTIQELQSMRTKLIKENELVIYLGKVFGQG